MIVICNGLLCHGSRFIDLSYKKKIMVYESLVEGAKDGFTIAIRIIPYLVAILVAIGIWVLIIKWGEYEQNSNRFIIDSN